VVRPNRVDDHGCRGCQSVECRVAECMVAVADVSRPPVVPPVVVPHPSGPSSSSGGSWVEPIEMDQSKMVLSGHALLAQCYIQGREFQRAAHLLERAHGRAESVAAVHVPSGGFASPITRSEALPAKVKPPEGLPGAVAVTGPRTEWPALDLCLWAHAMLEAGSEEARRQRLASADPLKGAPQMAEEPIAAPARAPLNPNAGRVVQSLLPLWHEDQLDPCLALCLGVALRHAGRRAEARSVLAAAAVSCPWLHTAWTELAAVCSSPEQAPPLPTRHFASMMFFARLLRQSGRLASALKALQAAVEAIPAPAVQTGIVASLPFRIESGLCMHALRQFESARLLLAGVHAHDPYCAEAAAPLSDALFVTQSRAELTALAHRMQTVGPDRAETHLVVGNLASLKGEHDRAVLHFKRALRADPENPVAWTLIGHECLEMKNAPAAVEAYRRALDLDPRDYRAWYGLGQAHELFGMHLRALDSYRRATALRPLDGRMWSAMGMVLDAAGRTTDAAACLRRAAACPESDGTAERRLAELARHRRFGNPADAQGWWSRHLLVTGDSGPPEVRAEALVTMARQAIQNGHLADALAHAEAALALGAVIGTALAEEARALQTKAALMRRGVADDLDKSRRLPGLLSADTSSMGASGMSFDRSLGHDDAVVGSSSSDHVAPASSFEHDATMRSEAFEALMTDVHSGDEDMDMDSS
jgi:tetratricopeptide (TPR) repeat protein